MKTELAPNAFEKSFSTPTQPRVTARKIWSTVTCRRFFRLAGLPAKQRSVQRRGKFPATLASQALNCRLIINSWITDGDKSPAESADKSAHSKACGVLRCWVGILLVFLAGASSAATNDLSSALQKGLFEEEANQNFEAAAQAYQNVAAQFDKDRKLAATAIFRLGEVYRKQGKTNEAVAQYERIVREFSDQQTLATLSRQNLLALNVIPKPAENQTDATLRELENKYQLLNLRLAQASNTEEPRIVVRMLDDEQLTKLWQEYEQLWLGKAFGTNSATKADLDKALSEVNSVEKKVFEKRAAELAGLKSLLEKLRSEKSSAGMEAANTRFTTDTNLTDDEEKEIRRIQALIQNSPDLINAGLTPPIFPAVEAGYLKVVTFLLDHGAQVNARSQGLTPLHVAAKRGQKAMAELLLARGAEVNAQTISDFPTRGRTPLHEAAEEGFQAVTEVLLANKADVTARDSKGNTPLHLAAMSNRANIVALLAPKMPDVNVENDQGITALGFAAAKNGLDSVKALLAAKADVNAGRQDTPLLVAINHRASSSLLELLLQHGADPNAAGKFTPSGHAMGNSSTIASGKPLEVAAERGLADAVKVLLQFNADPNIVDASGRTPLSRAGNDTNVVKLLLGAKADPNLGTADSPLLNAVRADNTALAEMLLRASANPNQLTECQLLRPVVSSIPMATIAKKTWRDFGQRGQRTPFQVAVLEDHPAMVKLLLQFNADPNATDPNGLPLVLSAVDETESLKAMLEAGADANANDGKSRYVLTMAASAGNAAAVELLLSYGAKTEVRNEDGFTPLLIAIANGNTNCVASLLAAKADVNAANGNVTPLHSAVAWGRKAILQMLLEAGANPNVRNSGGVTPLDLTKPQPGHAVAISPSRPGEEPRASNQELADLLRHYGALDDLPDFSSIRLTREGITPIVAFRRDTNGINRFTVLEVIRNYYPKPELVPARHERVNGVVVIIERIQKNPSALPFPDFSRIVILRPTGEKPGAHKKIEVNLLNATSGFDPAKDLMLEFGDVVEIPEREHALSESPVGLTPAQDEQLTECLSRKITFVIKDKRHEVMIQGREDFAYLSSALEQEQVKRVVLSSSDFSRIKVIRTNPETKKVQEFFVNAQEFISKKKPLPEDLWLRDGDVIEVPDK